MAIDVGGRCYHRSVIGASPHFADGHLEALAAAASILPWPLPREPDESVCHDAVRAVEALLIRVAEAQMSARGELDVWLPRRVAGVLALAFAAARKEAGRRLTPGECLVMMAAHFIEVWKPVLAQKNTLQRRILERDGWLCRVPGCSRAAAHVHHIEYRSHGGSDDPSNLVSLCAAHHLHGVHIGAIRVSGRAPDQLRWEVRTRSGWEPLFESGGGGAMS